MSDKNEIVVPMADFVGLSFCEAHMLLRRINEDMKRTQTSAYRRGIVEAHERINKLLEANGIPYEFEAEFDH